MFSDLTLHSVSNLYNTPGLGLELAGATFLAIAVVAYLARITWSSLAQARQMEQQSMRPVVVATSNQGREVPYCAG